MEKIIQLDSYEEATALFGPMDERLRFAEERFGVRIAARNHRLVLSGTLQQVRAASAFFKTELSHLRSGQAAPALAGSRAEEKREGSNAEFHHKGKWIRPQSRNQEKYVRSMFANDVVIGIGPAGTGKTYLAVAAALHFLKARKVARIILTRPAVEAGESLGFLPGDFQAKINPYLRPLYDALYEMMEFEEVSRAVDRGVIEIAPLAYMRGRTLNDSFIILDEAQNTTRAQMKMFLTRLGFSSRVVITGDITQIDLPGGKVSGLVEAQSILSRVKGLKFVYFTKADVVRHPIVQNIIHAYERYAERKS